MSAAPRPPLVSIDDYLAGELVSEVKHEYLGGVVYAMAGAKNVHNDVAGSFFGALYSRLRGRPCRPFNSDTKVRVRMTSHTRFYYPDGMVVCDSNHPDESYQDQPTVIAEVLSDSTRRIDGGEKRDAYLTIPSLRVYLLIDIDRPRVTVYRRQEQGFDTELYEGLDAVIPLSEVETELPLAELYERVEFPAGEGS
jgi:Uma2 family endonuclease